MKCIIVDDEPLAIEIMESYVGKVEQLKLEGTFRNAVSAFTFLQQHPVDVVLVDLEMPVMDGVELIRSIAERNLLTSLIILSAKDPILIASVGTMAEADGLHVLGTFQKTPARRGAGVQFAALYPGVQTI